MSVLGSAAAGAAQALGETGVGHPPGIEMKRRSASEGGRRTTGRSRSPGGRPLRGGEGTRAPTAECASAAPVFIEPGTEGHGIKSNAHRVFDYLAHLEKILNDHASALDTLDVGEELLRGRMEVQATDVANVKAIISTNDAEFKRSLERNDTKLKESVAMSVQALWDFLTQNNAGISQLFCEADAAMAKLVATVEESKADARLLQPSSVAGGPKGLAFMGLRTDLKKHEEHVKGQVEELKGQFEELKSQVNVANMSAGAATGPGGGGAPPRAC